MHGRYANESVPYDSELARHVVKVLVEACEEHEVYLGDLFSVRKKLPIVLDGLTGVVWCDDSQVCSVRKVKRWAGVGETPGMKITVWEMES